MLSSVYCRLSQVARHISSELLRVMSSSSSYYLFSCSYFLRPSILFLWFFPKPSRRKTRLSTYRLTAGDGPPGHRISPGCEEIQLFPRGLYSKRELLSYTVHCWIIFPQAEVAKRRLCKGRFSRVDVRSLRRRPSTVRGIVEALGVLGVLRALGALNCDNDGIEADTSWIALVRQRVFRAIGAVMWICSPTTGGTAMR